MSIHYLCLEIEFVLNVLTVESTSETQECCCELVTNLGATDLAVVVQWHLLVFQAARKSLRWRAGAYVCTFSLSRSGRMEKA